jgi:hypothetical protein
MTNLHDSLRLTADTDTWPAMFAQSGLDCVMDPMVIRAADLFIGGSAYCRELTGKQNDELWPAINANLDGIFAFFHALMTRDRIPVIDYGATFISRIREWLDPSILQWASANDAYENIRCRALSRLLPVTANFPTSKSLDLDDELIAVGYFWQPSLDKLPIVPEATSAARFALAGLVFGEYAQLAGADHILQNKRLGLLTGLGRRPAPGDWPSQERAMFAEIVALANRTEGVRVKDSPELPSVLPHLLAENPKSPRALLDDAIKLRATRDGADYRTFHKQLRNDWRFGRLNPKAEKEIAAVARQLERRIGGEPTVITHVTLSGDIKATGWTGGNIGIGGGKIEGRFNAKFPETKVPIAVPETLRNCFVENILFTGHQKLLLQMARDEAKSTNVRKGLYEVWRQA